MLIMSAALGLLLCSPPVNNDDIALGAVMGEKKIVLTASSATPVVSVVQGGSPYAIVPHFFNENMVPLRPQNSVGLGSEISERLELPLAMKRASEASVDISYLQSSMENYYSLNMEDNQKGNVMRFWPEAGLYFPVLCRFVHLEKNRVSNLECGCQ